ncbi:HAD family hydrolase [soil metagenome]
MTRAALVDLDGTLVDTTYLHTHAWRRALLSHGIDVPTVRLHKLVGMGASDLLSEVAGEPRPEIEEAWAEEFDTLLDDVRALPGADQLLRTLADRGLVVVVATSGQERHVDESLERLEARDVIGALVNSSEVEASKPAPDLFTAALDRAGARPDDAVAIGDTVWDALAARAAGVLCLGVRTGGNAEAELTEAGCAAVFDDPGHLARELPTSPARHLLSP